jgi:transposase-like protein
MVERERRAATNELKGQAVRIVGESEGPWARLPRELDLTETALRS